MTPDGIAAADVAAQAAVRRPSLDELDLPLGKRVRMVRLLYERGAQNGTLLALPIDQGLEHGPVDFFVNPAAKDPEFQWRLACEGGYNAIACHYGLARKYMAKYAGRVPLILKINGKTRIPPDERPLAALTARVADAVALGADAIGYTLYVGSPRQDEDIRQLTGVREQCDKYGLPLVIWAYPRGRYIERRGGRDSLYAVDYAARTALELGADLVKLNVPEHSERDPLQPKPYADLAFTYEEGMRRVVESAGRALVIVSGGSKVGDADLLDKVRLAMEAGATGLLFGRNMWQRPYEQALEMTEKVKDILRRFPS